jgi:hypothetical protein
MTANATYPEATSPADGLTAAGAIHGPVGILLRPTPPTNELTWQRVATLVAAAAGGAAWVSAVGSGVAALRLNRADLPVEPVVALMPAEHRFLLGAGLLILPLIAGLVAFFVDWAIARARDSQKVPLRKRQLLAVGTFLAGASFAYLFFDLPIQTLLIETLAVVIAAVIALHVFEDRRHSFHEALIVSLAVLGAAGAGAVIAESPRMARLWHSATFDQAELTIRGQSPSVTGGYITSTEHAVLLTTDCGVIEAVPRDLIARITVRPDQQPPRAC